MSPDKQAQARALEPEAMQAIDFRTHPDNYHHWRLACDGGVARLTLVVDEDATIGSGYQLKLNSYDLGVDIELHDAIQRLRFEHPEVGCVIVSSGHERVFCAGANIRMLGGATHAHKVNFCKFTNETRNGMEDASSGSGQTYVCAVKGSCAGGGYELALACDEIVLADDGASAVSLPEVPLLAVLPGTGGLTRLVDKRRIRRDRADFFCTVEEGIRGKRAVDWGLVDEVVPASNFEARVEQRAADLAASRPRPSVGQGVRLTALERRIEGDRIEYPHLSVELDRTLGLARLTVLGPEADLPQSIDEAQAQGAAFWPLALMRALDDAILHLRFNEEAIGTWVFNSSGDIGRVLESDRLLADNASHWFAREVLLFMRRVLKRLDVSARSMFAAIEPGSCFGGSLFELVAVADQSYMLLGQFEDDERPPACIALSALNFEMLEAVNGVSRLASRYLDDEKAVEKLRSRCGESFEADEAEHLGLVTFTPDDIDWEEELRILFEARAGFSPDALSGMEANLRFAGPETMESKIFARLSAWQNWIFQRPNAVGEEGALVLYGSGKRPRYNKRRV